MLFLIRDDFTDRADRRNIYRSEFRNLLLKMAQDHSLDGHRRCRDCLSSNQTRENAQDEPAEATKMETPASQFAAGLELGFKNTSVSAFVCKEEVEFFNQIRRSPACKPALGGVDRYGAMLAGMIDLYNAVANGLAGLQSCGERHSTPPPAALPRRRGRRSPGG